jgi:hypothetical protein
LGILPFHMSCDLWTLNYWHRLRTTSSDRLLSKVFTAWTGAANPWQRNINKLLQEYQVSAADTLQFSKGKFTNHVRAKITSKLQEDWRAAATRADSAILTRYVDAFGTGEVRVVRNGLQPQARKYIDYLTAHGRGLPAELIMGLRIESLPLRCMHSHQRRHETLVQQQQREMCPVCKQAAETAPHFLLECPGYNAARTTFHNVLRTTHPDKMCAVEQLPATQVWRSLLADDIIKEAVVVDHAAQIAAAEAAEAAAEAAATEAAVPGAAAAVIAAAEAAAAEAAAPEAAAAGRFTTLHALADYVMAAWKLRSTALTGRETNGGDPMV